MTSSSTGVDNTTPGGPGYREVLRESFSRRYEDGADSWSEEPAMRLLVPMLTAELAPGSHVIDIGAGRGRDAEALLAAGHRVTVVDLVRLPDWDALAERWGDRVEFVVGNFTESGAEAGSERGQGPESEPKSEPEPGEGPAVFDAAVDNGVLHHQDPADYPAYLAGVRRRLRPGGLLAISLFTTAEELAEGVLNRADDGRLSRWFNEQEAAELLSGAGFAVTTTRLVRRELPGLAYLLVLARRVES
ncbi:SAM-dependent methyltransferase [Streptomyces sp. NPDC053048]|uniref:SAM-dependent methyltransferase n=1 Tax=Streptomyces sp. NPDC053048 TaxID=3365694 RepID=UPI0037D3133F